VSRGKTLELLRPDDSGRLQTVYTVEMFACIRSLAPFRLTGATRDFLIVGSDSGRIVILEYVKEQGHFRKVHQETFGKSGCRRIVPGQFLAVDPKGRACMIGAHARRTRCAPALPNKAHGRYLAGLPPRAARRGLTVDHEGRAQPAAPLRRRTAWHARRVLQCAAGAAPPHGQCRSAASALRLAARCPRHGGACLGDASGTQRPSSTVSLRPAAARRRAVDCQRRAASGAEPGAHIPVEDLRGCAGARAAAVEKQKMVYVLNRDAAANLTISSPLEAHKSHTLAFSVAGLDMGFDNPVFAAIELDYAEADQARRPPAARAPHPPAGAGRAPPCAHGRQAQGRRERDPGWRAPFARSEPQGAARRRARRATVPASLNATGVVCILKRTASVDRTPSARRRMPRAQSLSRAGLSGTSHVALRLLVPLARAGPDGRGRVGGAEAPDAVRAGPGAQPRGAQVERARGQRRQPARARARRRRRARRPARVRRELRHLPQPGAARPRCARVGLGAGAPRAPRALRASQSIRCSAGPRGPAGARGRRMRFLACPRARRGAHHAPQPGASATQSGPASAG